MRWFVLCLVVLLLPATASADMGLARKNYNRLWKQVAPAYGQKGQPPPTFIPVPKGGGDAYVPSHPLGQPPPGVALNPSSRRQLKRNPQNAQFTMLHEWGHVFGAGSEGHANRVANLATRELRGKLRPKIAQRKIRNTLNVPD